MSALSANAAAMIALLATRPCAVDASPRKYSAASRADTVPRSVTPASRAAERADVHAHERDLAIAARHHCAGGAERAVHP